MDMIQRILFVELLGGIGDIVIALPAIHALARSHSTAHLTVLTFTPGSDLLQTDPLIQQVIVADRSHPRASLEALLAESSFDLIVSDTNYDRIPEVIQNSTANITLTNLWQSPPSDERVGDRFLKLLFQHHLISADALTIQDTGIHLMIHERNQARQFLGAAFRPLIVLIPDAGMTIKKWSTQNFITLGKHLIQCYDATLLIPEGSDLNTAIAIAAGVEKNTEVIPKQGLRQMAALLAAADLVVAADTGLARIAAALDVPTITLFGPSWQGRYGQPTPHVNLQGFPNCPERVIHNFTDQSCWYSGYCPYEWRSCLDDITPDQVFAAAAELLQPNPSHSDVGVGLVPTPTGPESKAIAHPDWSAIRNVLVMRLDNIGDVMMTSPVFQSLKDNLPNVKITLMASPSGSLAAPLIPGVDEVLPWRVLWQDLGRLDFNPDREWNLIETLRQRQFDAAIILTSFAQSPHPAAMICALAGIPLRLGESKERDFSLTHAVPPAPDDIHQVDRNLRLIEFVGFRVSDRRLSLHIQPLTLDIPQPYLLLNPWTSCQSRNYDPDRFAQAAHRLSQITGWSVVVTGVEKDRDRATPLLEQLGKGAIDLIGQTTLAELVSLVANAKLVLTNNTSTMHIADATHTPNVVMFAGTELERQWQPRFSPSRLLRRPTVCSPCYTFTCPYQLECLDIPVNTVVETSLALLKDCGVQIEHPVFPVTTQKTAPTTPQPGCECEAPVVPSGGGVGDAAVPHIRGAWGAAPQAEDPAFTKIHSDRRPGIS